MNDRYILILGAGLMQRPSIEAAKELGYKALVIDANPDAVCVPFADRFEKIDLKDTNAIVDFSLSLGKSLCAVFTAGTDFSVPVSLACQKCGFVSHSFESAMNASNKILMRECFKKNKIPSPDFFEADENYINLFQKNKTPEIHFPKVVKPVDNMGARGCRLVRNKDEFLPALKDAVCFSRTKKAIVEDFMEVLSIFVKEEPHLVLMDIGLPLFNGYHWCQEIRKVSKVPIMFLSSRDQAMDIVMSINMGADDYMTKPFSPSELVARVKAVLRRTLKRDRHDEPEKQDNLVEYVGLQVNLANYSVVYFGRQIDMPPKELELLYFLASSPNQVFTREQLLDHIWGYEYIGDTRTVDVHIKRLREKIKDHPSWSISTVWGIGYKFEVKNT